MTQLLDNLKLDRDLILGILALVVLVQGFAVLTLLIATIRYMP